MHDNIMTAPLTLVEAEKLDSDIVAYADGFETVHNLLADSFYPILDDDHLCPPPVPKT